MENLLRPESSVDTEFVIEELEPRALSSPLFDPLAQWSWGWSWGTYYSPNWWGGYSYCSVCSYSYTTPWGIGYGTTATWGSYSPYWGGYYWSTGWNDYYSWLRTLVSSGYSMAC